MDLTVDTSQLPVPAQRLLDPASPAPVRQMAARGIAPGLKPGEALTVVALLSTNDDAALAQIARGTLEKLPTPLLNGALGGPLSAGVIDLFAPFYAKDLAVMERVLTHASIAPETVARVAAMANEPVSELIATNEERLLAHPVIIEALYKNKNTRMSTADRILELAVRNGLELHGIAAFKEAAQAIQGELIMEPSEEPTPDDVMFSETLTIAESLDRDAEADTHALNAETGEEEPEEDVRPLFAKWGSMTGSQKIRMLTVGGGAEAQTLILLGVRDPNPLVATAAIKSPGISDNIVIRISAMRNTPEEVLRIIGNNREWTKTHQIKYNLVSNPRTPFAFAAKWIPHLRENEVKGLTKSKDISGAVRTAAQQQIQRKTLGGK